MARMKILRVLVLLLFGIKGNTQNDYIKPDTLSYKPFVWVSEPPADCPFEPSKSIVGIYSSGLKSGFHCGDTWYPSWAENDKMYSPWTDGSCWRLDGSREISTSYAGNGESALTGQAVIEGEDPLSLKVYSLGTCMTSAQPYHGRYPCGSLVYNGVWYYGTYCLDPAGQSKYGENIINWPWMGSFVGFRYSTDYGKSSRKPLWIGYAEDKVLRFK